ncbi:alpha/beta hydrolase [Candidatus Saccharibacteria bacterium]|nr:alpha/beta hydrolase [Candidatus Saccharibacteria bacterium]MBI3337867.1 alpha/beta hydrolase [Candidatus Saccharibacteria bacterium]
MQLIVDSLITNYTRAGRGKVIVLLHGWGDSLATFNDLGRELAGGFEVITLDLPGFGQTQSPKFAWTLDDYAHFVKNFLDKLGVKPDVIVGHSNGGALAIRGLSMDVLKSEKLVLLASSGVRNTKSVQRNLIKTIAKIGKISTFWMPRRHKQKLQKWLYGAVGSDMLVVPHMQETFRQTVRQDIQKDALKITVPTLLIYGDKDRATPSQSIGNKLHKLISGSQMEVIPEAGHFIHHDALGVVAKLIKDFA